MMATENKSVRLKSVVEVIRGVTYGAIDASGHKLPDTLPLLRAGNIQSRLDLANDLIWVKERRVAHEQRLKKYDLVMCTSSGSSKVLGKTAMLDEDFDGTVGAFCAILRPRERIHPNYFKHWLASSKFLQWRDKVAMGVNIQNIRLSELGDIEIQLPPLGEQQRIAAILDKADAIRRKRQQSLALTEDFLRSVFLDMFGDIPARKSRHPFGIARPFVAASSGKSSKGVLSEGRTGIPVYGGNGINGWATKALYEEPVVVIGRVGQQCGITQLTSGPAWVTDNAIVVQVTNHNRLDPVYLATAFQHSPIRITVERLDLPFINQAMLLDFPIPIPPIEQQQQFVTIRHQLLSARNSMSDEQKHIGELFNSLVQRAFRGEL